MNVRNRVAPWFGRFDLATVVNSVWALQKSRFFGHYRSAKILRHHHAHFIHRHEGTMAKAYWVATHRSVSNPDGLAAQAKLSGGAVTEAGGRSDTGVQAQ